MSLRKEIDAGVKGWNEEKEKVIWVLWHDEIAMAPYLWRRYFRRKGVVLTSASKDGAYLASAVRVFGLGAVHGSSSRRGAAALVGLRRAARAGNDLIFTPDGPRGPRHILQGGVVKMAEAMEMCVVPVRLVYCSAWKLKTWDRFQVPKPFSRVRLVLGEPMEVERGLGDEEFELVRKSLESRMGRVVSLGHDEC